ncbi:gamma-D-glutamyl-{L}-meso-diaminopimelate peptidase I Metallo peptidase. MEROPS family M14C [Desulfonispora thiosulfatigenes DSM 11270]|uniref:Gamma-D-glutamyl-(L)-meso-diaminopimelate peptidase I Metallo peptidase. MEROPS family M14C n=1 Tax=Desulfonispora thiosulfatigenes DSM 11270 TaxID=656914 RepID=A0A1W1VF64_DESTI|nr:M14 family metallopeptidase [Desulfonispora thiosulfatigenes]SMB92047.1 gamma-D-glutamyl-{L}-meso-diaminopimelate peptidase I Metallo peptidase. MEROPS family M14C [Desulfonispora thiosulfatigenes DSM 11270]
MILKIGSKGTVVKEIQSLLVQIGYNPGPIDGYYGTKTFKAVRSFQKDNNLTPDGIIGPNTYTVLEKFLKGYDIYYVQKGDTLWKIARNYYTTVGKIIAANPGIDPDNLYIGQRLTIPYGIDLIDTKIDYTYEILKRDIEGLKARYPFIEVGVVGKSVLGKNLYYIRLGTGKNEVFYNAAHHALEWITSPLLMKFTENFLKSYTDGKILRGYNLDQIWKESSIYIMPMVNPDGVNLVLNGLDPSFPYYNNLIKWNKGSKDFSKVWQANIRGVDLNHNYPAKWQEGKEAEEALGIYGPGPTRYSGPAPLSEPETQAVVNFVKQHDFRLTLAYHSQGQEIYWDFENMASAEARKIGEAFAKATGYELAQTYGITSYSGFKDWFILEYRKPGYTFEVGLGKNPLPIEQFPMIYQNNEEALLLASII